MKWHKIDLLQSSIEEVRPKKKKNKFRKFILFLAIFVVSMYTFYIANSNQTTESFFAGLKNIAPFNLIRSITSFSASKTKTLNGEQEDRINILLAPILNALINFAINIGIFFIFWIFTPTPITIYWLLVPVYISMLIMLTVGISWFTSVLFIVFRDLWNMWEVGLQLLFYLTPIIYPITLIPAKFHKVMILNPMTAAIRDMRLILIQNQPPGKLSFIYLLLESLILLITGYIFFKKYVGKIAERY